MNFSADELGALAAWVSDQPVRVALAPLREQSRRVVYPEQGRNPRHPPRSCSRPRPPALQLDAITGEGVGSLEGYANGAALASYANTL